MTKFELQELYPEGKVFNNQYEMGKFIHELGTRKKVAAIINNWPMPIKDTDIFYDVSELSLSKGVSFYNDGVYIIEDLKDVETDLD